MFVTKCNRIYLHSDPSYAILGNKIKYDVVCNAHNEIVKMMGKINQVKQMQNHTNIEMLNNDDGAFDRDEVKTARRWD